MKETFFFLYENRIKIRTENEVSAAGDTRLSLCGGGGGAGCVMLNTEDISMVETL